MKSLLYIIALAVLAASAFAQSEGALNAAIKASGAPTNNGVMPPTAALSYALINNVGQVIVNGKAGANSGTLVAGTTVTFTPGNGVYMWFDTPAQAQTINAVLSTAVTGGFYTIYFVTSGTTSYTITFGTAFSTKGTLETGTVSAAVIAVLFQFDGTSFREIKRERQGTQIQALVAANPTVLPWGEGVDTYTLTPTGSVSINAPVVGRANAEFTLKILTSGTSSFTQTFNTNFKSTGTLATGTADAKTFYVRFKSDGTTWNEISRTAAE